MAIIPVTKQQAEHGLVTIDAILDAMTMLAKKIDENKGSGSAAAQQNATSIAQLGQALDAVTRLLATYHDAGPNGTLS